MSNKVNAKLYKLQDSLIPIYNGTENLINTIVELYNDKTGHDFKNIALKEDINQIITIDEEENSYSYNAKLFVLNTEQKTPDWINFANTITLDDKELEGFKIDILHFFFLFMMKIAFLQFQKVIMDIIY